MPATSSISVDNTTLGREVTTTVLRWILSSNSIKNRRKRGAWQERSVGGYFWSRKSTWEEKKNILDRRTVVLKQGVEMGKRTKLQEQHSHFYTLTDRISRKSEAPALCIIFCYVCFPKRKRGSLTTAQAWTFKTCRCQGSSPDCQAIPLVICNGICKLI
jgi:hypothetical protein